MDRVLYVGKFQPVHYGHKSVIEKLDKKHDELIIVIGGADCSYTEENIFTTGERVEMIKKSVDVDFESMYIIPVRDISDNTLWPHHVNKYVPSFHTLYTNNPLVQRLFIDSGYDVQDIEMVERNMYSGTKVRSYIKEDNKEKWQELVPDEVEDIISELNGFKRFQSIQQTDYI